MDVRPRPRHAAAHPVATADRAWSSADLAWLDGSAGRASRPGRSCRRQVDGCADLGCTALAGTELEFIVFEDTYEQAWDRALPRPDRRQPVQRRLLHPGRHPGRAAAARDPQRDVRRRADGRERQGRVQPRPARDRLPVRRGVCTCDNHAVYKTAAKEIAAAAGQVADLHGQVRRARGQLLPHPPLAAGRRRRECWPTTAAPGGHARCSTTSSPALLATLRELHPAVRAEHQLLQAVPARARSRPPRCAWGVDNRTCALRVVGHGAGAAGGEPAARRRRQPLPGGGRHARRRPARRARASSRSSRPATATPTAATRTAVPGDAGARRVTLFAGSARGPGGVRRRRRRPLRQRGATSSWRPSTRRSPTGSACRGFERL